MQLVIQSDGTVLCVYDELVDLAAFGVMQITRASHVEPEKDGRWIADLSPAGGPRLGPFGRRSDALEVEKVWLESNRLTASASS